MDSGPTPPREGGRDAPLATVVRWRERLRDLEHRQEVVLHIIDANHVVIELGADTAANPRRLFNIVEIDRILELKLHHAPQTAANREPVALDPLLVADLGRQPVGVDQPFQVDAGR